MNDCYLVEIDGRRTLVDISADENPRTVIAELCDQGFIVGINEDEFTRLMGFENG